MSKRIKDFFITLGGIALASFTTVIFTPQWADFVNWSAQTFNSYLVGHGAPITLVVVVGLFLAGVWKHILNTFIIKNAGYGSVRAGRNAGPDLY